MVTQRIANPCTPVRFRARPPIFPYVEDTGSLISLDGRKESRRYYEALFAKFHVRSVDVVQRLIDDWFLFSELLWTFEPRAGGDILSCSTAKVSAIQADGRLICRIGHGTALAPI